MKICDRRFIREVIEIRKRIREEEGDKEEDEENEVKKGE